MKKAVLWFLISLVGTGLVFAQEGDDDPYGWKTTLEASLALTQAAYSDNWDGGEVGSIIWTANVHATAQKQLSELIRVENDLQLAFGQTHSQDQTTYEWAAPLKSTDKIDFQTLWKCTMNSFVDPYAAGQFISQFYDASPGYEKRYLNPIELIESAGVMKTLHEVEGSKLTTRVGLGLRQFISQEGDSSGVITPSQTTSDGGLEWVTNWTKKLSETTTYTTELSVFQAFFYSEEDAVAGTPYADDWKAADVIWQNLVAAQVAQFLQVSLAWELHYDKQISLGGRFKETLAMGVAWIL
ncbi:hypothetical protein CEE37_06640 [candidate division LCP-89 bacterium B3_LCP]|uniref:DUF3078 domain-containing protein n=1 Tax=candidate division LCP-89 bacterium B3_LCP TaxID=2012998 RepID=A0A532V098_UNCL8|nr:MAG: hypothetical protein CEE37_06640 [candidate division LCP-89 bacterium B3_LCP]